MSDMTPDEDEVRRLLDASPEAVYQLHLRIAELEAQIDSLAAAIAEDIRFIRVNRGSVSKDYFQGMLDTRERAARIAEEDRL
jgi:hypothetical protein